MGSFEAGSCRRRVGGALATSGLSSIPNFVSSSGSLHQSGIECWTCRLYPIVNFLILANDSIWGLLHWSSLLIEKLFSCGNELTEKTKASFSTSKALYSTRNITSPILDERDENIVLRVVNIRIRMYSIKIKMMCTTLAITKKNIEFSTFFEMCLPIKVTLKRHLQRSCVFQAQGFGDGTDGPARRLSGAVYANQFIDGLGIWPL